MNYPLPYALGICAATLAFLAACIWLTMLCMEAAAAYLNRLDNRAAARKREAARRAEARRTAARARLARCGETMYLCFARAAEVQAAVRAARYPFFKGQTLADACEVLSEAEAAFEAAKREAAEADEAAEARNRRA
jgi:hypothetical protein